MVAPSDDQRRRFEEIYRSTYPFVLAYCRRRLTDPDASDAASRVFVAGWENREQLVGADAPLAWLYRVAYNTISSMYRSQRSTQDKAKNLARVQRVHAPASDNEIGLLEELDEAVAALATIQPDYQEVIRLAAYEELSYAKIGVVLDISAGAARSKLYRARQALVAAIELQRVDQRDNIDAGDTNLRDHGDASTDEKEGGGR